MIDQTNSFNLMAYCNLYIQSRDNRHFFCDWTAIVSVIKNTIDDDQWYTMDLLEMRAPLTLL